MLSLKQPEFDFLAIGEALAVLSPAPGTTLASAVSLSFGTAGAETNVARALALLGNRAAWFGAVGLDPIGDKLLHDLANSGVDTSYAIRDGNAPTGVYFKDAGTGTGAGTSVYYYRAGSAASRLGSEAVSGLPSSRILHLSGITPAISTKGYELTQAALNQGNPEQIVTFDVNHRPSLWVASIAAPVLASLADAADIVFVGLDEATRLWGIEEPEDIRDVLPSPKTIVVKDNHIGATSLTAAGTVFEPTEPVDVVESVGAGDSFAAGYIHGILHGLSEQQRLQLGHAIARRTLQTIQDLDSTIGPDDVAEVLRSS